MVQMVAWFIWLNGLMVQWHQLQEGDAADIDVAVAAATKAFAQNSAWRQMDASARGLLMHKFADLIERDAAILAVRIRTDYCSDSIDRLIELIDQLIDKLFCRHWIVLTWASRSSRPLATSPPASSGSAIMPVIRLIDRLIRLIDLIN